MQIVANARSLYSAYLDLRTAYAIVSEIERMKSYQLHVCEGVPPEDEHMMVKMCEGYANGFIQ
jgi:hypothetical protein